MKNTRSMMTKLAVAVVAMTCLLCVPQTLMAQKVEAATKNQKAHTAYDKRISYYKRQGYRKVSYQYVDITGDSVDEAVVRYTGKSGDDKQYLRILDYSGKVNRLLLYKESPTMRKLLAYKKSSSISPTMRKLLAYKKSSSIILYTSRAGFESYTYFTIVGSKYSKIASKTRVTGTQTTQPWVYYNASGNKISQDRFKTLTSPLKKGTKKRVKF